MKYLTYEIIPTWSFLKDIPREHPELESSGVINTFLSKATDESSAVPKYSPESRSSDSVAMAKFSFE